MTDCLKPYPYSFYKQYRDNNYYRKKYTSLIIPNYEIIIPNFDSLSDQISEQINECETYSQYEFIESESCVNNETTEQEIEPKSCVNNETTEQEIEPMSCVNNETTEQEIEPKSCVNNETTEQEIEPKSCVNNETTEQEIELESCNKIEQKIEPESWVISSPTHTNLNETENYYNFSLWHRILNYIFK